MSASINKVILIGNVGRDPESRTTSSGSTITSVAVATNESWKDKQTGELQERKEWHRVKFFGRQAEIALQYLKKGSQVYIEGKLRTEMYEKDGVKKYATEVVADVMKMLGGKPDSASIQTAPARATAAPKPQAVDEEVPF